MNPFAIVLVLVSTFMHAGWNLLARYQRSEAIFFSRMLTVVVRLVGTVMITFVLVLIGLRGG